MHSEKYILLRRVFFAILCLVESIRCIESPFPSLLPPLPRPDMLKMSVIQTKCGGRSPHTNKNGEELSFILAQRALKFHSSGRGLVV